MKTMLAILALGATVSTGCGSDETSFDASVPADMSVQADLTVHHCLAYACYGSCPATDTPTTHCVNSFPSAPGGCTAGESTCGTHLTGDCGFTARCLSPTLLGTLFIAVPEGGCGVELIACANGCADADADGGVGARCR
jgi:hypothetical protein